jgi:hypothetical protein
VKTLGHLQTQAALAVEHLGHTTTGAEVRPSIFETFSSRSKQYFKFIQLRAKIGHRQIIAAFFKKTLKLPVERPNQDDETPKLVGCMSS